MVLRISLVKSLMNTMCTQFTTLLFGILLGLFMIYTLASFAFLHPELHGQYYFLTGPISWDHLYLTVLDHLSQGFQSFPVWGCYHDDGGNRTSHLHGGYCADDGVFQISIFLFSMVYTWSIGLICVAMISGIVVDAFARGRESRKDQRETLTEKCLICGATRDDLETMFDSHYTKRHPLRNYTHLLIYILSTLDENTEIARSRWFQFDHVSILHMLQKKVNKWNGDFFPSFPFQPDALATQHVYTIANTYEEGKKKLENLSKEYLEDFWDVACPLHQQE